MKYNKNKNIFKNLNNPNVLYTLGLFAADGHVNRNRFNISLSVRDRSILDDIKRLIGYTGNIKMIPSKINKHGIKTDTMCKIDICSKSICNDIMNLGFSSRKTYDGFELPNVSDNLLRHFIRGYFDGDGSFSYKESIRNDNGYINKCYNFNITSKTDKCLNQIKLFFIKYGIKTSISFNRNKNVFYLNVTGKNNIAILYDLLYYNAEMFLMRKKEIFDNAPLIIKKQGVYKYKDKFKASLKYKKKDIFLGIFSCFNEASNFRDKVNYFLYGHIAKLNNESNRKELSESDISNILTLLKKYDIILDIKYGTL